MADCLFPKIDEVVESARSIIRERYPMYGNSWVNRNEAFWGVRMHNECNEFSRALTDEDKKRKCVNIATLAMMAYTTIGMPLEACKHSTDSKSLVKSIEMVFATKCSSCGKFIWLSMGNMFDTKDEAIADFSARQQRMELAAET